VSRRPARNGVAWYLDIAEEEHEGIAILTLAGRVGVDEAGHLEAAIAAVARRQRSRLLLDLTGVDYLSSAGLAVLDRAATTFAARNGTLVLAGASEPVLFALELGGLLAKVRVVPP
jgi:anti-anti-sigma factor